MINLCEDSDKFLDICDRVKEVKDARLTENILYNCMIAGLYNNQILTYISHDDDKMNGYLVLSLTKDQIGELTLVMLFTWIDAHYPKLHKEFIDIAIENSGIKDYETKKLKELIKFENKINRKIQIHLFNRKKIDINIFNNIANGIVLSGFLEVKP